MQSFGRLILSLPTGQEQEFILSKTDVTVGRATVNDIALHDAKLSRAHARLECTDQGCAIVDLHSVNGTRVNGKRIERATLAVGDVIALGDSTLRFESAARAEPVDVTQIHSEADLDGTLANAMLSMTLSNTHAPRLVIRTALRTWQAPFLGDALTIGRDSANDVVLDDHKVSRHHARIERRGDQFIARDLSSRNGTWVGGQPIEEFTLTDGSTIRIGDSQLVFKRGFQEQELTLVDTPSDKRPRRPVVIVPGLMGSQLWRGSECLWPNARLFFTHPEVYVYSEQNSLEPRDILRDVIVVPNLIKLEQYGRLGDYIVEELGYERGKNLFEFAYDWRQDVRTSARQLAQAIDNWKLESAMIIAHSLGCLVSRYYVERVGGKEKTQRLLLIGGPHSGVPQILPGLLYGQGLLPFGLMGDRIRTALITFPSVYQILPTYPCVYDQNNQPINVLEDETWVAPAQRPLLRAAREFRQELGTHSSVPTVSIFGYGLKTISRFNVERNSDGGWDKVTIVSGNGGDDTIPDSSTVLDNSEIHPVEQHHGSLYVDNDVKMRLKLELNR